MKCYDWEFENGNEEIYFRIFACCNFMLQV